MGPGDGIVLAAAHIVCPKNGLRGDGLSMPDLIYFEDRDSKCIMVNKAIAQWLDQLSETWSIQGVMLLP